MTFRAGLSCLTFLLIFQLLDLNLFAQDSLSEKQYKNYYLYGGIAYAGSMLALNQLWYADHDRSSFHTFNDNEEWLQMDKAGHVFSAYALSSFSYELLKGKRDFDPKAAKISAISAFTFLSTIEIMDGFSEKWGFSWGDMISNTSGIGLFYIQEALFQQQILRLKFSYQPTKYRELRPNLLGNNELQGIIKDYNGQIYWASLNLNGLDERIRPRWLNLAFGYGAEGMISANENNFTDLQSFSRKRQYFLSLDIDFTKIKTSKPWVKTMLKMLNVIKVPSPTMELNQGGESKFHWLYF